MPPTYSLNWGGVAPCPQPEPRRDGIKYGYEIQGHLFANHQLTGRCLHEYQCDSCGALLTVDSSD